MAPSVFDAAMPPLAPCGVLPNYLGAVNSPNQPGKLYRWERFPVTLSIDQPSLSIAGDKVEAYENGIREGAVVWSLATMMSLGRPRSAMTFQTLNSSFMNPALQVELFDGASHIIAGQLFDDSLQGRIFLPHDVVETGGVDTSLLELLIRSAGIYRFVLAHITDQEHAILWSEALEERVQLFRARQTGFVEHAQPL